MIEQGRRRAGAERDVEENVAGRRAAREAPRPMEDRPDLLVARSNEPELTRDRAEPTVRLGNRNRAVIEALERG
jgi:hypothetical protein